MKNYGKIIKYDGISGYITGIDGKKYILLDKNIIQESKELKINDDVEFETDCIKTPEIQLNIARFVKVLKKSTE